MLRLQKNRLIRQAIAYRDEIHVSPVHGTGIVGGECERLIWRQLDFFFLNLVPDVFVDSLRIAWAGRKKIDNQEVNAVANQLPQFLDEGTKLRAAGFISRRH